MLELSVDEHHRAESVSNRKIAVVEFIGILVNKISGSNSD